MKSEDFIVLENPQEKILDVDELTGIGLEDDEAKKEL